MLNGLWTMSSPGFWQSCAPGTDVAAGQPSQASASGLESFSVPNEQPAVTAGTIQALHQISYYNRCCTLPYLHFQHPASVAHCSSYTLPGACCYCTVSIHRFCYDAVHCSLHMFQTSYVKQQHGSVPAVDAAAWLERHIICTTHNIL